MNIHPLSLTAIAGSLLLLTGCVGYGPESYARYPGNMGPTYMSPGPIMIPEGSRGYAPTFRGFGEHRDFDDRRGFGERGGYGGYRSHDHDHDR
jgi:hypothetical protein